MTNAVVSVFPERNRAIYDKIRRHLKKQQFSGVVQPAKLRTEVYTQNGKSDYTLALRDNAARLTNSGGLSGGREVRLKEQDAFVWTRVRVGALLETIAGPLGHERTFYFNPALPFADEVGGFQNAHLAALWNGNLYLKVGDTVYLENFLIEDCQTIKTQQETASLKTERDRDSGWIDLTPQFAIKGFDDNDFRLKLPNINANHKIQYNATSQVVVAVEIDGYKITGAGTGKLDLAFANE